MSDDLSTWLTAQIDAAEERTRKLLGSAQQAISLLQDPKLRRFFLGRLVPGWHDWPDVERACTERLAELAADRRILDLHPSAGLRSAPESCGSCASYPGPCDTLRRMATPYAGQPGYRSEWRTT
ncbi:DUF6221 family protein [Verrucosispora sp. WMMC514]|uniref:DUF6221 family protein n=1 Tax=Verrucosispora sp. WMMC514 TaxID=3015156 RepID=UPI00248B93E8|nr:DUF6221 family protein [Verrucosispora sp. WMMC514]WBB94214.1 DUF6221 family protein [Verrucosispora sp. WMMC514]